MGSIIRTFILERRQCSRLLHLGVRYKLPKVRPCDFREFYIHSLRCALCKFAGKEHCWFYHSLIVFHAFLKCGLHAVLVCLLAN